MLRLIYEIFMEYVQFITRIVDSVIKILLIIPRWIQLIKMRFILFLVSLDEFFFLLSARARQTYRRFVERNLFVSTLIDGFHRLFLRIIRGVYRGSFVMEQRIRQNVMHLMKKIMQKGYKTS